MTFSSSVSWSSSCLWQFLTLPFICWSSQFWGILKLVSHIVGCTSVGIWCFSGLELWGHKYKVHFLHILSWVHTSNMIYNCWCWPWSPGIFSRCLHCKVPLFPFLSILYSLKGSYPLWLILKECGVTVSFFYDKVSIFWKSVREIYLFSPVINLFNHSSTSVWTHRYVFYSWGYNRILPCCLNHFKFVHWDFFHLAPVRLWHIPPC